MLLIRLDLKIWGFLSLFKTFLSCIRVPRLSVASNVHTHTCILCAHGHSMHCCDCEMQTLPFIVYSFDFCPYTLLVFIIFFIYFLSSFIRYIMFIGCYVFPISNTHAWQLIRSCLIIPLNNQNLLICNFDSFHS